MLQHRQVAPHHPRRDRRQPPHLVVVEPNLLPDLFRVGGRCAYGIVPRANFEDPGEGKGGARGLERSEGGEGEDVAGMEKVGARVEAGEEIDPGGGGRLGPQEGECGGCVVRERGGGSGWEERGKMRGQAGAEGGGGRG